LNVRALSVNLKEALPRSIWDWLILIFLLLCAAFFLMPMYVMVVTGLKQSQNVSLSTMWHLPTQISAGGFGEAWNKLSPSLWNSFQLTIPATIFSSILGSINGYIFSKWKFPGANYLFALLVFGMFIPYQSILIPLVQFLQMVRLYGSIPGLILVHVIYGLPITSLIFRNFFTQIPDEMLEAARIDGAGIIRTFFKIMLPLGRSAFVVVGIFQFTNIWNDFLFGITVVPNPAAQPVTVAVNNLQGSYSVDWNVVMAGSVLVALPTLLIYVFLGRFFVRGMLAGSVKG